MAMLIPFKLNQGKEVEKHNSNNVADGVIEVGGIYYYVTG